LKPKKTRNLLLQTAIRLFAEKGYADTSIREIGKKAGVSTSVLYHYFKSKEEMLFEVISTSSSFQPQTQGGDPDTGGRQSSAARQTALDLS
jgi:AcrR family transcriptional regulator